LLCFALSRLSPCLVLQAIVLLVAMHKYSKSWLQYSPTQPVTQAQMRKFAQWLMTYRLGAYTPARVSSSQPLC
jgi:hypothetical protein